LREFESRTGLERSAIAGRLDTAERNGWIDRIGDKVVPTEFGRRFTNDVIGLFLND
jgi:oxygen-independent coproporphyrinogen-3 oxidase